MSRNVFSKKQLYKKVPILDWLPKYDVQTGVSDLIAGVTVGLTVIPQGIAYALIAKLPPQVKSFFFIYFYLAKAMNISKVEISQNFVAFRIYELYH